MNLESLNPKIEESWKAVLESEFSKDYFYFLKNFLQEEKKHYEVYPPGNKIFSAYNLTPFNKIKAVIIGQDPYHNPNEANGLCFSVNIGIKSPPSLVNIFKELYADLGCAVPTNGNLEKWAAEGVFLLNTVLTVRKNTAGSHKGKGWEQFTDATIRAISLRRNNIVFLLWGKWAQEKAALIDSSKHLILKAAHPSPLARTGFAGCRHFSKANEYLISKGVHPIDWCL